MNAERGIAPARGDGIVLVSGQFKFAAEREIVVVGQFQVVEIVEPHQRRRLHQVVGANQLTAQVDAPLIAQGQVAGIAVRNPQPAERISAARVFVVTQHGEIVYLPNVRR